MLRSQHIVFREGSDLVVSSLAFGDNGTAWVVDVVGRLWFTTGISWDNPCGTGTWWQVRTTGNLQTIIPGTKVRPNDCNI